MNERVLEVLGFKQQAMCVRVYGQISVEDWEKYVYILHFESSAA